MAYQQVGHARSPSNEDVISPVHGGADLGDGGVQASYQSVGDVDVRGLGQPGRAGQVVVAVAGLAAVAVVGVVGTVDTVDIDTAVPPGLVVRTAVGIVAGTAAGAGIVAGCIRCSVPSAWCSGWQH